MDVTNVEQLRGQDIVDRDGDKVGKVEEIYLDQDTDRPEWALVNTGGLFGKSWTFVPLAQASTSGGGLQVPYEKATIKGAPQLDPDGELTQEQEAELYRYYGLDYGEERSDSGLPEGGQATEATEATQQPTQGTVGRDVSGPETDEYMTRSEEELRVGTVRREAGRARLRKYIVTERVQTTVPLEREEIRVEREPITDANMDQAMSGAELTEEVHEVTLSQEEAVVDKTVVPKERVRLDKDVVTEQRQVTEEIRKEQIDIEGDVSPER